MRYFFVFIYLLAFIPAISQKGKTNISGTVIDKTSQQPIEYVTVSLLNKKDSTIISGVITDNKGKFMLNEVFPGEYLISYGYIGNVIPLVQQIMITGDTRNVDFGIIELKNEVKNLSEVVVNSAKPTLNTSIDRKVYQVDQDIMSKSGAATDIMRNIPSVEVDIEGQISLRGSSSVLILINGKISPLMGKSRAEVLQSLPANSIERIEVITNPSARFRPDGTSGIINIVLKKNSRQGWNGSLIANAGNRNRKNTTASLNYNPGKVNLSATYGLRQDSRTRTNKIDRTYFETDGKINSTYNEYNVSRLRPLTNLVNGAVDVNPNEHNSFGISGGYYYRKLTKIDALNKFTYNTQNVLIDNYDRFRNTPEFEKQTNVTAYFDHKFAKEDHEIKFAFNKSTSKEEEDNHYRNVYNIPSRATEFDNNLIKQSDFENQLTIDYSLPVGEDAHFEAGYDGSFNKKDLDFYGENFDNTQLKFIKDMAKSNRFLYKESLQAIYTTFQKSYESFGYSVGLRAEQVYINGHLVTIDSLIKNNYFKVYPTLHLSYKLSDARELQLNYSRRINRPDADELNPFPEYRDPRNLSAGNPKLLPEIINSAEFGYKWQNKNFSFVPSVYYRYKTNGFTQVIKLINDSTFLTTSENLSNDQSAGLEMIFSAKAGKLFSANMSGNVFYNRIDASNLGFATNKSIVSFSTNINAAFSFTDNSMLQLSSTYRSARLTPQGKSYPRFIMNMGMRQDVLKKKLTFTLTVSDFFSSGYDKREFNTLLFNQSSLGRRDARIFYLGANYRFGKTKKAPKDEKLQFDNSQ